MSYQQCRYREEIEEVPLQEIDGEFYVFLNDIRDRFPGVQYFTCDKKPISFVKDNNQVRLKTMAYSSYHWEDY